MKNKLKKSLILSCVAMMFATQMSFADTRVERIAGGDRYETALKVNQRYISKADGNLAVIASGEDFKSALYGSYMANALKVPFFTVEKNSLSKNILDEFSRLNVKRVSLVGSERLVSKNVENQIKSRGIKFERIYNSKPYLPNRIYQDIVDFHIFDTFFHGDTRGDIINGILINDNKFPDLLSSIPFVSSTARSQATYLGGVDSFEIDQYDSASLNTGWRFIIGGYNSVPNYVKTYTNDILGINIHKEDGENYFEDTTSGRLAGDDRYKTAVEVAKAYKPVLNKDIKTAVIVDGTNYPDALASGIVATFSDGAVLLTEPNKLNQGTKKYIVDNNIENIVIVGGEKSVSKNVEEVLKSLR